MLIFVTISSDYRIYVICAERYRRIIFLRLVKANYYTGNVRSIAFDEKYTVFAFASCFEFEMKAFFKLFKTYLVIGPAVLTDSNMLELSPRLLYRILGKP